MLNILIAEDNKQMADILSEYTKKEGFMPYIATNGQEALNIFYQNHLDFILLDITMPKLDGFAVCSEIRKASNVPIIMITARRKEYERIAGLNLGADDYIIKPFSMAEAMARIQAVLRRQAKIHQKMGLQNRFVYDNLRISLDSYTVYIGEQLIELCKRDIELLWLLATNQNKIFTRENLLDSLWGHNFSGYDRTVDTHIKRLRAKIDEIKHPKWQIMTIRGVGYKFEVFSDEE